MLLLGGAKLIELYTRPTAPKLRSVDIYLIILYLQGKLSEERFVER